MTTNDESTDKAEALPALTPLLEEAASDSALPYRRHLVHSGEAKPLRIHGARQARVRLPLQVRQAQRDRRTDQVALRQYRQQELASIRHSDAAFGHCDDD